MIIAINGRIGHGKDTVGRIIQYLTMPGKKSEYIGVQTYDDYTLEKNSPFKIKKFAAKLKIIASLLTGIPVEKFEDQDFKKLPMTEDWNVWQVSDSSSRIKAVRFTSEESAKRFLDMQLISLPYLDLKISKVEMTYREFLQKLGTEAMREGLHENVWVNALFADYIHTKNCGCEKNCRCEHDLPNWIITDMRFPNEMEAVKERGGITIKVVRPVHVLSQNNHCGILHPSETSLDNEEFDYTIVNDSTIEDLVEKVREILINEKLL